MKTKTLALAVMAILLLQGSATAKKESGIKVIPYPLSVELEKGQFKISGAAINCDQSLPEDCKKEVSKFANILTKATGETSSVATTIGLARTVESGAKMKGFAFYLNPALKSEEYQIVIDKKSARVCASDRYGFIYAIQTLKQMLPAAIYGSTADPEASWKLPCCTIKDKPFYKYRGMHLDSSRHFWSVEEVKKYLDILAVFKLNRFHWHLTDDQGWRIEIKKYPLLTQIGGFREGTMIGKDFKSDDGIRYGGYYTQDQIRDVIAYADALGITIVPEIDLPGHMQSVITAYPELGCTGGPYEVWKRWGVSDQVLCPGSEGAFDFLEGVLGEIAELFPSEYIHIGGDECDKVEWEKCEKCQALIKELGIEADEKFTAEQYLQNYVTHRVKTFLESKGKKVIGWDEILQGGDIQGATVMAWNSKKIGQKAAQAGMDVIFTPHQYCYFDHAQAKDEENEPLSIGGSLTIEKVYKFDPLYDQNDNVKKHTLGVQANLWTEYIATPEHLEYMLLPRLCALSEVQWCPLENKDFERFKESVITHEFPIFDLMGYTYSKRLLGIQGKETIK